MTLQERSEFSQKLVNLSLADESFKSELIADPRGTLEKMGVSISEGTAISVNDQSDASVFHINIPASEDGYSVELSEQELEAVSGGSDWFRSILCGNNVTINNGDGNTSGDGNSSSTTNNTNTTNNN